MDAYPESHDELRAWADAVAGVDATQLKPAEEVFPQQSRRLYETARTILEEDSLDPNLVPVSILVGHNRLRLARGAMSCDALMDDDSFDSVLATVASVAYSLREAD